MKTPCSNIIHSYKARLGSSVELGTEFKITLGAPCSVCLGNNIDANTPLLLSTKFSDN